MTYFFQATVSTISTESIYIQCTPSAGDFQDPRTIQYPVTSRSKKSNLIGIGRLFANSTYDCNVNCVSGDQLHAFSFTTGPLPTVMQGLQFTPYLESGDELYRVNYVPGSGVTNYIVTFWKGRPVHYIQKDRTACNGNSADASIGIGFGLHFDPVSLNTLSEDSIALNIYAPNGSTLQTSLYPDCCPYFHHEMWPTNNPDKFLTMGTEIVTDENFARPQASDIFMLWDIKENTLDTLGRISDFITPSTFRTAVSSTPYFFSLHCDFNISFSGADDWTHGNALTESHEFITYSARDLSTFFIFDKSMENLLYTVGGPHSDFTFPDASDRFSTQHTVSILKSSRSKNQIEVLLFDNANDAEFSTSPISRGMKLILDLTTMTASAAFKVYNPIISNCISNFTGSFFPLDDGNFVLNFPTCTWNFTPPGLSYNFIVDKTGTILRGNTYFIPATFFNYRLYVIDYILGEEVLS